MLSTFHFLLLDFKFILSESPENAGDTDFPENYQEEYPGEYELPQEDELNGEVGRTQRSVNNGFIRHAGFYGFWIHGFMQPNQYQYVGNINDESISSPLSPVPYSLRNF
jgi:hypothetical protein